MNQKPTLFCLIEEFYDSQSFTINDDKKFSESELTFLKHILITNTIENLFSSFEKTILELSIFSIKQNENSYEELKEYFSDKINIHCFTNKDKFIEYIKQFSKYVMIYSDVMGISPKDIKQTESLISSSDNLMVISKSDNNDICFVAFNKFDNNLIELIIEPINSYDELLSKIETEKFFIQTLSGHFRVKSFSNFKLLYHKLSQKESLEYCSQEIHEKFTNLFIEYRDYIK